MRLRKDTLLIDLQMTALAGIVVFQALGMAAIAGSLFTVTFFLTAFLWLQRVKKQIRGKDCLVLLIMGLSGISVCADAILTDTVVAFSYFKKLIMFWTTLLYFCAVSEYRTEPRDARFLFRWNSFVALFLILVFVIQKDQMHTIHGIVTIYLTFGFTNPNLAAGFLSAVCMIEVIHAAVSRNKESLLHLLLAEVLVVFVFLTRARNAQLVLALFLAGAFLSLFLSEEKCILSGWMAVLVVWFPFLFALGYLLLVSTPWVKTAFSFLVGEGKGLDSRVGIWTFALKTFGESPLFGAYSQISGGTGASQMHNSHLDILASYGAAGSSMTHLTE